MFFIGFWVPWRASLGLPFCAERLLVREDPCNLWSTSCFSLGERRCQRALLDEGWTIGTSAPQDGRFVGLICVDGLFVGCLY